MSPSASSYKLRQGASGFWFILISGWCLSLCCRPNDQSAPSTVSPINSEAQTAGSSAISGRVFFKGNAPAPKPIRMSEDPACAQEGGAQAYSEEFALNRDGTLANVFVYVKEGLGQRRYAIPTESVVLNQRHCRYAPHVFGIQVGQTLKILNSDPTFHNVHAAAGKNQPFNLGMSKVEKVKTRTFDRAEVMIPIRCNVHPWMSAYAGVVDHPFYCVTDSTGSYKLKGLPAGQYQIAAWHELFGGLMQNVQLAEAEIKTIDFTFTRR
jgi:plastocyanin